jgi:hypothetical protein
MTLFEYLAIAFGLLYSVAGLRILGGLSDAMAPGRRYGTHLALMFVMLALVPSSFWTFWSLRDVAWSFFGFMLALLVPGVLYYCAAVLVPENPAQVPSWRQHYFANHRRWYAGLALWGLAAAASASVNLDMPLTHPARRVHAALLIIGIAGCGTSRPRVHAGLAAALIVLMIGGAVGINMTPGWLAR